MQESGPRAVGVIRSKALESEGHRHWTHCLLVQAARIPKKGLKPQTLRPSPPTALELQIY